MKLLKLVVTFCLFVVSIGSTASAQDSRCALKLADLPAAPELRGFRVGMSVEQVRARMPKFQLRPANEFGLTSLNIFPDYEPGIDKSAFEGVRTISLEFLDGHVFSLWIGYDKTFKWQTIDEFVSGIAGALKLPDSWRMKFRNRLLDCADFSVTIAPVAESPSIKIVDEKARELLDKRQTAKEEAQP